MNLGWPYLSRPLRHPVCRPIVRSRPAQLSTFLSECTPANRVQLESLSSEYALNRGDMDSKLGQINARLYLFALRACFYDGPAVK